MSDILKQIDQLVADKTFSLDALDGIKAIRDALIKAETTNKRLLEENASHIKELTEVRKRLEDERVKSGDLLNELQAMKSTVAAGKEAIYTSQKYEAVAAAWKEAMQTVFKPNTIRESVSRSIPVATQSGPSSSYVQNYNDSSTIVREEG